MHVDWMLVGELASLFKLYRQDSVIYDVIGIASCLIRWYIHQRAENHWTLSCCSNFVMNDGALFFCLKYSLQRMSRYLFTVFFFQQGAVSSLGGKLDLSGNRGHDN